MNTLHWWHDRSPRPRSIVRPRPWPAINPLIAGSMRGSAAPELLSRAVGAGPERRAKKNARIASMDWERIAIYLFGVLFVIAVIVLAIRFAAPTALQSISFKVVLVLVAAAFFLAAVGALLEAY